MPAFYILIAVATLYLFSSWKQYAVLSILLISMMWTFSVSTTDHSEFDKVAEFIKKNKKLETPVFICPPYTWLTYLYHFDRSKFKQVNKVDVNMNALNIFPVYHKGEVVENLTGGKAVYIDVAALNSYPENGILDLMSKDYSLKSEKSFKYDLTVYMYEEEMQRDTLLFIP
jgi:hypothetical protein